MAVALAIGASWPISRDGGLLLLLGTAGIGCLCLGLLAIWVRGLAWGIALLAAGFLLRVQLEPSTASGWTPLFAAALLLVAELGYWSFEESASGVTAHRLVELLLLVVGASVLCQLVLDIGSILPVSGGWMLVIGVLAVTVLLGMIFRLARRAET